MNSILVARALRLTGKEEEALEVLRGAIAQNPEFQRLYFEIAGLLDQIGRLAESTLWLRDAAMKLASDSGLKETECYHYVLLAALERGEACYRSYQATFPAQGDTWTGVELMGARGEYQSAVDIAERIVAVHPTFNNRVYLAWSHLDNQDPDAAHKIWQELVPDFLGTSEVAVTHSNLLVAALVGYTLYQTGETGRAEYLFEEVLTVLESLPLDVGDGEAAAMLVHAARGDREEAVAALRDQLANGWSNWIWLRSPINDGIRDHPDWQRLLDQLDKYLAAQRRQFEENISEQPVLLQSQ
jgi:tetratricopeptide (TPR) repeat protein